MSPRTATVYDSVTEKQWQQQVSDLLKYHGYRVYHTYNSIRSEPGFPDVLACNPRTGDMFVAELKSEKGVPTAQQLEWLAFFECCDVTAYVWRPHDIDLVVERVSTKVRVRP